MKEDRTSESRLSSSTETQQNGSKRAQTSQRKPSKRQKLEAVSDEEREGERVSDASSMKAGHVRFDSEEPQVLSTLGAEKQSHQSGDDEEDKDEEIVEEASEDGSDDEAPEDVAAQAAEATSRAASRKVAKANEVQRHRERKQRQNRESKLKDQAESSTRRRKRPMSTTEDDLLEDCLPDLLPEDILAGLPIEKSPTPPPEERASNREKVPAKHNRVVKFEEKQPKARKVGPVSVSVLQEVKSQMAPKANAHSRSVKDQWLVRRRGKGNLNIRQPTGRGFLVRK